MLTEKVKKCEEVMEIPFTPKEMPNDVFEEILNDWRYGYYSACNTEFIRDYLNAKFKMSLDVDVEGYTLKSFEEYYLEERECELLNGYEFNNMCDAIGNVFNDKYDLGICHYYECDLKVKVNNEMFTLEDYGIEFGNRLMSLVDELCEKFVMLDISDRL